MEKFQKHGYLYYVKTENRFEAMQAPCSEGKEAINYTTDALTDKVIPKCWKILHTKWKSFVRVTLIKLVTDGLTD